MANYKSGAGNLIGIIAVVAGLLCTGGLTGCGQKGPLYLPDEQEKQKKLELEQQKKKKAESMPETETETNQ